MSRARRRWMIAALVTAVVVLATGVGVTAYAMGRGTFGRATPAGGYASVDDGSAGWRAGMMGGYGPRTGGTGMGMMSGGSPGAMGVWQGSGRFGLAGDGQPVMTLGGARARAQTFADRLGADLRAGEVMQFSNGYYVELVTADGQGATEVLVDPGTGAVSLEYGPAMMWNTQYGMHATGARAGTMSAEQAVAAAQAWLDANRTGLTAGEATAFPGYDTLHTLDDGAIVGMMSVNSSTGASWYHTWHGTFVAMDAG